MSATTPPGKRSEIIAAAMMERMRRARALPRNEAWAQAAQIRTSPLPKPGQAAAITDRQARDPDPKPTTSQKEASRSGSRPSPICTESKTLQPDAQCSTLKRGEAGPRHWRPQSDTSGLLFGRHARRTLPALCLRHATTPDGRANADGEQTELAIDSWKAISLLLTRGASTAHGAHDGAIGTPYLCACGRLQRRSWM